MVHSFRYAATRLPADGRHPANSGLLEVTQPPPPVDGLKPIPTPVALVELSGCRRVVAPETGLVGYLTQAQTEVLQSWSEDPPIKPRPLGLSQLPFPLYVVKQPPIAPGHEIIYTRRRRRRSSAWSWELYCPPWSL